MSVPAAVALEAADAPDVLVAYARFVAGLTIGPDAKRVRRNAAASLLDAHPDPGAWMQRPTPARLADLRRTQAWSLVTWCLLEGLLEPDLDLLVAKTPGDLYLEWGQRHRGDVERVVEVARRFAWSDNWTRDVSRGGLALMCLWAAKNLDELTHADFDAFTAAVDAAPSAGPDTRSHNHARAFSLHQACYELRICSRTPRKNRPPAATLAETLAALPQPEIRRVALRYLEVVATTLRPSTVGLRADSLIVFGEYLAVHHPDVRRLEQLERAHIDGFLVWNHRRPWRGWLARDKPVSASVSKRAVVDLRAFFEDLAVWGWAQRPPHPIVFAGDVPRLDRPLPKALPPGTDRDLMAAVNELVDPFARHGLTILRGTGMRLGELLDLELDCLWDFGARGTWVKAILGTYPDGTLAYNGTQGLRLQTNSDFVRIGEAGFGPLSVLSPPIRLYDSRTLHIGGTTRNGPLSGGENRPISIELGNDDQPIELPVAAVRAAIINLTITDTVGSGFLAVGHPGPNGTRTTSNINWSASDQTLANLAVTTLFESNLTVFAGGGGSTNFVVDLMALVG
jgi:hypothetical protein